MGARGTGSAFSVGNWSDINLIGEHRPVPGNFYPMISGRCEPADSPHRFHDSDVPFHGITPTRRIGGANLDPVLPHHQIGGQVAPP